VLLSLLLKPSPLFFFLLVHALSIFATTLVFFTITLLTFLAPPLLLFLSFLLTLLVLFLFTPLALFFLGLLFMFDLTLLLELGLSDSFSLFLPCLCLLSPLLVRLASALLFLRRRFRSNLNSSILPHLGKTLIFDQLIKQRANSVHYRPVNVDALSSAFYESGRHAWVFG